MRSQDSSEVQDALTAAIDTILVMPDKAVRLAAFAYMRDEFLKRITRERAKAAYEARLEYTGNELAEIAGCKPHDIYRWATEYAQDNRLPVPRRIDRVGTSRAVDIASKVGVYRR